MREKMLQRKGPRARARNGLHSDMSLFSILIPVALALVLVALLFGIYALFRGGDFGRSWSNKAMRMRVIAQFVAILVLVGAMAFKALSR